MKNNRIGILFDTRKSIVSKNLDVLQYALIGLGYRWQMSEGIIGFNPSETAIYINLKTGWLEWDKVNPKVVDPNAYVIINFDGTNLVEVVDFVKNPPPVPKNKVTIEELDGEIDATVKFVVNMDDKTVKLSLSRMDPLNRRVDSHCNISSETIRKVNDALGNKQTLPLVTFYYPDSKTKLDRKRIVRLVQITDEYVRGYELENTDDEKGTYKQFSKSRIQPTEYGSVHILSFN